MTAFEVTVILRCKQNVQQKPGILGGLDERN